jgi:hypothetical protein
MEKAISNLKIELVQALGETELHKALLKERQIHFDSLSARMDKFMATTPREPPPSPAPVSMHDMNNMMAAFRMQV